jgi:hypothetical protein
MTSNVGEADDNSTELVVCLYSSRRASGSIHDTIIFYVRVHVMISLTVIGLLGNAFTLPVLSRELKPSSTSFLLKSLAMADSMVLLAFAWHNSLPAIYVYLGLLEGYYQFHQVIERYIFSVLWFSKSFGVYMIIVVAIERYIAVCKPLHARSLCTVRSARIAVVSVTIFSIAYNLPIIWHYDLIYLTDQCTGMVRPLSVPSFLYLNNEYFNIIYNLALFTLFSLVIPVCVLYFTGFYLIRAMRRTTTSVTIGTHSDKKRQKETHVVTFRVVIVVAVFLILETPTHITNCLYIVLEHSDLGKAIDIELVINLLDYFAILSVVNSSVNFFIYFVTGSNFRRSFLKLFTAHLDVVVRRYM